MKRLLFSMHFIQNEGEKIPIMELKGSHIHSYALLLKMFPTNLYSSLKNLPICKIDSMAANSNLYIEQICKFLPYTK